MFGPHTCAPHMNRTCPGRNKDKTSTHLICLNRFRDGDVHCVNTSKAPFPAEQDEAQKKSILFADKTSYRHTRRCIYTQHTPCMQHATHMPCTVWINIRKTLCVGCLLAHAECVESLSQPHTTLCGTCHSLSSTLVGRLV